MTAMRGAGETVAFGDGELEVGLATCDRPEFVEEWFRKCLGPCAERNLHVVVYDSSTDDATAALVRRLNETRAERVGYVKVPSDVLIGQKPLWAIENSSAEYVWVSGDSRYPDFSQMDALVFPLVRDGLDFVTFYPMDGIGPQVRYTDKDRFLYDAFASATCIGTSIFRAGLFEPLRKDESLRQRLDSLFDDNYGFAWLGYFYCLFGMHGSEAAYANVASRDILPSRKVQSWAKRFYGCWCEDLCKVIDGLPDDVYRGKGLVPKHVWDVMNLDSLDYCFRGRIGGDLTPANYSRFMESGMLERCTYGVDRMGRIASCPVSLARVFYFLLRSMRWVKRRLPLNG